MMNLNQTIFACIIMFSVAACQEKPQNNNEIVENPPAEGFNLEASDSKAIEIADSVMKAMGGRNAWDNTRYLRWNFFGSRRHYWDKWTGQVRIESLKEPLVVLMNINTGDGTVQKNGEAFYQEDSLKKYLELGKRWWVNDSYWLVMPFKLKDSGVTLSYVGVDTTMEGVEADKLQLTFDQVGFTPQNKYHVWVDREKNLVTQWAFFREANLEEPNFITPWNDYQRFNEILLSGDRGQREITEISVFNDLPESVFSEFEAVEFPEN
jgi:hypothetical protein